MYPEKSEDEIKPIPTDKIVSFHNLKFALKEKKIVKAREEMGKLVLVSDGKQILEYLLELSMLQTGQSFLFIWSALRSYNFFGNENYLRLFNLCLDSINSDKFARENGHVNFFHHAITKQIKHDKLVRNIFIEPNLYKFELKEDIIISQSRSNDYLLSEIVDNLKNNQEVVLEQITDLANQEDRIWLSDLLKQIEVSDYSPEMIMLFDSMRILLRFSQNKIWAGNQFGFKLMSEMKHVE